MQQLGSQRSAPPPSRPRFAGAWLDCSAVAYYTGVALGIAASSVLLYLLLGVVQ